MSATKATLIIIGFYLATVIAFDIIGVLANSLFDIFTGRGKSTLLFYTVWFVAAIFAGTIYFLMAYDYISANVFFKNNSWLIVVISIVLSITALWFFGINGQLQNVTAKQNYYVPGNESMTYTFFITFILASLFSWYIRLPQLSKNKKEEKSKFLKNLFSIYIKIS